MTTARFDHTATPLPHGRVLICGGNSAIGMAASAEIYDPVSGTFSATGNLVTARQEQAAVCCCGTPLRAYHHRADLPKPPDRLLS